MRKKEQQRIDFIYASYVIHDLLTVICSYQYKMDLIQSQKSEESFTEILTEHELKPRQFHLFIR